MGAMNTMVANMGQSNYIASNSYLDKQPAYERPEVDAITLMWGPVGGIGMRQKAFASADMLQATPDMLMSIFDAQCMLSVTCTKMDLPEWYNPCFYDDFSRENTLKITVSNPDYRGEDYSGPATVGLRSTPILEKRPVREQQPETGENQKKPPLEGWLQLTGAAHDGAAAGAPGAPMELREGARVRLKGLNNAMNGLVGTVIQQFPLDDKWKVLLEGPKAGKALLKDIFLEVITEAKFDKLATASKQEAPNAAEPNSETKRLSAMGSANRESNVGIAGAAKRRQDMEEHRAKLKEKRRQQTELAGGG